MGGNGTFSKGHVMAEEQREWKTIDTLPASGGFPEIAILEMKSRAHEKTPQESSTKNIYAVFNATGSDVREISVYGKDRRKLLSIHTNIHHGITPHYHFYRDGKQMKEGYALTSGMQKLLNHVRNYKKKN